MLRKSSGNRGGVGNSKRRQMNDVIRKLCHRPRLVLIVLFGLAGLYALYFFSNLVTDPSSAFYDGADDPDNVYTVTPTSSSSSSMDTCEGLYLEHDGGGRNVQEQRQHASKAVLVIVTRSWQQNLVRISDLSFIFSRPIIQHALALASATHLDYKVTVLYAAPERSAKDDFWRIQSAFTDVGIEFRVLCVWPGKYTTSPPYKPLRSHVDMLVWLSEHQYEYSSVLFDLYHNVMYYALQRRHIGLDFNNLHFAAHALTFQKRTLAHRRVFLSEKSQIYEQFFESEALRLTDYVVVASEEMSGELTAEYPFAMSKLVVMNALSSFSSKSLVEWQPPPAGSKLTFFVIGTSYVSQSDISITCDTFRRIYAKQMAGELDIPGFTVMYSGSSSKRFKETCMTSESDKNAGIFKMKVASYGNAIRNAADNRDRTVLVVAPSRVQDYQLVVDAAAEQIALVYPDDYASLFQGGSEEQLGAYASSLAGFEGRLLDVLMGEVNVGQLRGSLMRSCGAESQCQANVLNSFLEIDTDRLNKRQHPPLYAQATRNELVSVVIPNYGRTQYLEATIESIRRCTWRNLEVIVVDDGSSEKEDVARLERIKEEFATQGWRVIQTNHVGAAAARNTGAKAAKGQFVMLFDSDDFMKPKTIELMVKTMLRTDADVVTGFIHGFGNPADEVDQIPISPRAARPYWLALGTGTGPAFFQNTAGGANALFRTAAYLEVGGETEVDKMAHLDYEFFVRLGLAGKKFQLFPDVGYDYRRNAVGSIFAKNTDIYRNDMHSLKPFLKAVPESMRTIVELAFANNRD